MGSGGHGRADATFNDGDDRRVRHPLLEPGQRIDRYVIRENLGAGSMGMVVRAHDPGLSRDVALKLVPVGLGRHAGRRLTRLRREAQALARLNHGNVVTVLDVGRDGDLLYVAMELVEGADLRSWLEPGRPTGEVIDKFCQAGRGLAAAHAAGIVHRDFKPENVMVGKDGRVRVTDFGLAREFESADPPSGLVWAGDDASNAGHPAISGDPFLANITRDGALVGTPRYMSPEQFAGASASPLSDQFSFCVALFEALTGRRPYSGQTVPELQASISHTRLRFEQAPVPRSLRQALRRGLSARPELRFATMDELIDAIRGPSKLWPRLMGGMAAGTVAFVAVALIWDDERAESCEIVAEALEAGWDDGSREDVRARLTRRSSAAGEQLYEQVLQRLDAYVQAWSEDRRSLCSAQLTSDLTADERELAVTCFDERRRHFEALVGVLRGDTEPTVWQAADAVDDLPPISSCTDTQWLKAAVRPPDDPDLRLRALEVETQLAEARSLLRSGAVTEALDAARASLAAARVLDHAPLYVESLLVYGRSQSAAGHYKEASRALEEAYFGAVRADDDLAAADAATSLIKLHADELGDATSARTWVDHAQTALDRSTVDKPALRTGFDLARCTLHEREGRYDDAFSDCSRAYETATAQEDDRLMSAALNGLAWIEFRRGTPQEAVDRFEELEQLVARSLGPDHPNRATVIFNLGNVLVDMGRYADARRTLEQSLEIRERVLGSDHIEVAHALAALAQALILDGDPSAAQTLLDRAMAIHRRNGSDEWATGMVVLLKGNAAFAEGQFASAEQLYRRVLAERERRLPADHGDVTDALTNLGASLAHSGDHAGAIAILERAREAVRVQGDHPAPEGNILLDLAEAHRLAGSFDRALATAHEAESCLSRVFRAEHPFVADTLRVRGLALHALERNEEARVVLADASGRRLASLGPDHRDTVLLLVELSEVERAVGAHADAIAHAEQAVKGAAGRPGREELDARAGFALARALAAKGTDRARARQLATAALAHHERTGTAPDTVTTIERWLRTH